MSKLDRETFNFFLELLNIPFRSDEENANYVSLAINLAPDMANEILLLREVALAGNGLVQWGVGHDRRCATRMTDGYCDCGQEEVVNELIHAFDKWQRNKETP